MVGVKIIQEIWYNTLKSVYLLFCTNLFFFSFAGLLRLAIYSNHGHLTVHSEYSFLSQSFDLPWRHPSSLVCHEFIYQSRLEWGKFPALWSQGVELCPHTMNGDCKRGRGKAGCWRNIQQGTRGIVCLFAVTIINQTSSSSCQGSAVQWGDTG